MIFRSKILRELFKLVPLYALWLILLFLGTACTLATIRPIDPVTGKVIIGNEAEQFNAATYVTSIWESEILPLLGTATDINVVRAALIENSTVASEQYGHRVGQQPYSFVVSGNGIVISVNTESRAGLAMIDTDANGEADLALAIGPVIRGTALRDGMPFISFNQFTNQMEFASVSNEMNLLVNRQVISPIGDIQTLVDKQVTFAGAFTLTTVDEIVITPGILTVSVP